MKLKDNLFLNNENVQNYKIAYVHTMYYPSQEANALQAIKMAAAFSKINDTTFFIPRKNIVNKKLKQHYAITDAPLNIHSMALNRFSFGFNYHQYVLSYFRFHPSWAVSKGSKILFVRVPKELIFWGLQRERHEWLKKWTFVYEAHDISGLDLDQFKEHPTFDGHHIDEKNSSQVIWRALRNFDLVICVTKTLADDLTLWSSNTIQPHVIRHASPLTRVSKPPVINFSEKKIVIGYVGTIDHYRGVNVLMEAIRLLPQNFRLRLVGRVRQEKDVDPNWLEHYMKDPRISNKVELIGAVPVGKVAEEIDRCDILVQPASSDIIDSRYASPLKSYDYMVRGKPIIVADVPCHHELFCENINGYFYRHDDPKHLAEVVEFLVNDPKQAQRISHNNWEQAIDFSYDIRAKRILGLVDDLRKRKSFPQNIDESG